MKKITRRHLKTALLLLICAASANICAARAQTSGGFSISAVIPENQIDTRQTYFDLKMQPGQEQTLEIIITNSRDESMTAELYLNSASTGRNGLIVYTEPDVRDELMELSVSDIATLESTRVTVPARGTKAVPIKIKMPDKQFDGVILGGIAVTGAETDNTSDNPQGVALKNKITYVIALKLTETNPDVPPDFDITAITPTLVNFRTAVEVTLQNKAARIVKNMAVNAQVFRGDSATALHELSLTNAEMAPLSSGSFVIDWGNQPLSQGVYRLKMTADYDGETWVWEREFTIGGEAAEINGGAVDLARDYTWLYALSGIAALTLVWAMAYRSGKRRKRNEGSGA